MQRQSLSSPVSKLHSHGGGSKEETVTVEDLNRNKDLSSFSPCSSSGGIDYYDEDDHKTSKPHRFSLSSPPPPRPEKFIHFVPVLTLLCFLVLYLFSHSPSESDLAQFHGFKPLTKHIVEMEEDVDRLTDLKKSDVLAIGSLRNLQEIGTHVSQLKVVVRAKAQASFARVNFYFFILLKMSWPCLVMRGRRF